MEGNYWIRPLLECLAVGVTGVFGTAYVVARVLRLTLAELFDRALDLLTR